MKSKLLEPKSEDKVYVINYKMETITPIFDDLEEASHKGDKAISSAIRLEEASHKGDKAISSAIRAYKDAIMEEDGGEIIAQGKK